MWNTTWNLRSEDFDAKRFPSSGPYKIESVSKDGAVVLVANDKWWGAKPVTDKVTVWPRGADIQDRVNQGAYDVVDIATGSSGTLNLPDDYVRTDSPSAGIEQLIFAPQGPLAGPPARRALALCTPRDVIAQNAALPIANARLNPATEDAFGAAEGAVEAGQFVVANPDAARAAINGQPLTVRIGYQSPNARLAATVGAIAKACAPAGITVQDAASDTIGPLSLRDNKIDVLIASTGGAAGSGSTGSSAMDAYDLHTGNGNNLSGYSNERIDGIIASMAVIADPKELARLLGEGGPILWADMPTLPLYRQQRTLLTSKKMYAVSSNPTRWGAGWNMDRWVLGAVSETGDRRALIASLTREVADFPEPGIQFKDLTPLFADDRGFAAVTDALADVASGTDLVAGVDARGFLLARRCRPAAGHGRAGGPQGRQAAAAGAQRDLRPRVRHRHPGNPGRRHRAGRAQHRHHRRRAGHRGHGRGHRPAAQQGRRDGHGRRGGA